MTVIGGQESEQSASSYPGNLYPAVFMDQFQWSQNAQLHRASPVLGRVYGYKMTSRMPSVRSGGSGGPQAVLCPATCRN
ncbi:hypothetical protein Asi03nite_57270 [Actinoplanes siamensis]|uniref:Uncharacterized protein n=1 Tax=Actinoplanes siamensis TaxID=1223317 RepID=A0A919NCF9_9ACTN|nr:hypothetical protein Asi03nite_57270 [Actinoplanes siamensis]